LIPPQISKHRGGNDAYTATKMSTILGKGNDELLDGANEIQDKTFESLNRTNLMIQNSKEVGTATLEGHFPPQCIKRFLIDLVHYSMHS
jgi:hypothetical protein